MAPYRFEYRDDMAYDLTDLELFLQVVDQGSITQGAEHTHLSLASASARITAIGEGSRGQVAGPPPAWCGAVPDRALPMCSASGCALPGRHLVGSQPPPGIVCRP